MEIENFILYKLEREGEEKTIPTELLRPHLQPIFQGLEIDFFFLVSRVLTVKPGFVKTKMTNNLEGHKRFASNPEKVAADIYKAQQKQKNILYTSWIWRWIMWTVKLIPESKFKKIFKMITFKIWTAKLVQKGVVFFALHQQNSCIGIFMFVKPLL